MNKPDPIFGYCDECGGEIYYGDDFYDIPVKNDHVYFHEECIRDFKTVADLENYVDPWDEYDGGYEK